MFAEREMMLGMIRCGNQMRVAGPGEVLTRATTKTTAITTHSISILKSHFMPS
jgi:hypothetical protein